MLKRVITYTDYNGVERSEPFYFNISKAELMEMETGVSGGFRQLLQLIIDKQDIPRIMSEFKKLILDSYGEKTPDGREFVKSPELSRKFSQTEAYSNLYVELVTNSQAAAAFINGIFPADVVEMAEKNRKEQEAKEAAELKVLTEPDEKPEEAK